MFAIVLAALDRSGSVLPILYAMGVHELAHVVMMLACGGRVRRLTLRFADLRIDACRSWLPAGAARGAGGAAGQPGLRGAVLHAESRLRGLQPDARDLQPAARSGRWTAAGRSAAPWRSICRWRAPRQVSRRSSFAVCAALLLAGIILTFFRRARALAARHGGVSDAPAADAGKAHGRIAPTGSSGRETERFTGCFLCPQRLQ